MRQLMGHAEPGIGKRQIQRQKSSVIAPQQKRGRRKSASRLTRSDGRVILIAPNRDYRKRNGTSQFLLEEKSGKHRLHLLQTQGDFMATLFASICNNLKM